jgi:magnesium transporter
VFKVIDLPPDGKPQESNDESLVQPPPKGTIRWVEVIEHDAAALELLRQRFGFHPLAIEDCSSFELRSKIEEYDDYLFIVLHSFTADPAEPGEIQVHEIHAFLSASYLVTVHDNPVPATETVWSRAARDSSVLSRGPCWALYMTADMMVDAMFPVLSQMADDLEELEDAVLDGAEEEDLVSVFQVKRTLVNMRRVIRPARDVIGMLSRRADHRVTERTAIYFRDVYDHIQRVSETIEEARDLAANAMDAYQTTISNRTNEVMKKLTIFSAIFLPLGFITGFWGQNFSSLPVGNEILFYSMLGSTVVIPLGLLYWFSKRRWL